MRCTAHSRSGARCKGRPIRGGSVCRMHGGGAPQVKRKAAERLLALQSPAIDRLQTLMAQTEAPATAYAAVRDVLDRTMGKPKESLDHSGDVTLRVRWEDARDRDQ
jgi:hypothetical protein